MHDARKKELDYLAARKVYTYAAISTAIQKTGRRPLRLKWIDCNKGDKKKMQLRSRLVCTEVKPKGVESIFAATPPLESLRLNINRFPHSKTKNSTPVVPMTPKNTLEDPR